jgi:hypothetical protein
MKIFDSLSIHREKKLCASAVSPVAATPAKEQSPVCGLALAALVLGLAGCGASANLPTAASNGQVNTYYSGPVQDAGYSDGQFTIDHYGSQLSFEESYKSEIVPTLEGTFTTTASGFSNIAETAGPTSSAGTSMAEFSTPLTGAWLAEMQGVAAAGNLLNNTDDTIQGGAATVMAANTECPNFPKPVRFLYVTPPPPNSTYPSGNSYGTTDINTQGSSVDFNTTYYTLGQPLTNPTTVQGVAACATTALGSLISYPVNVVSNSLGSNGYSVIAKSQFLAGAIPASAGTIYTGQNVVNSEYVVGLAMPSTAVSTTALAGTHFIGLLYNPSAASSAAYDPSVLAGAFGDYAGASSACANFQAGITASLANGTISQAPSSQAIYGGDFSKALTNGAPGDLGTETCDMAIDLGAQDSTNYGLFPNAQLYAWTQPNVWDTATVTSATGAAIVSQIDGRYVILFSTTSKRLLVFFQALQ